MVDYYMIDRFVKHCGGIDNCIGKQRKDLYDQFTKYCEEEEFPVLSSRQFTKRLNRKYNTKIKLATINCVVTYIIVSKEEDDNNDDKKIRSTNINTSRHQCFHCGHNSVCWDGDFNFEDFGYEGEGIIHMCHCGHCGAEIEYRISTDAKETDDDDDNR